MKRHATTFAIVLLAASFAACTGRSGPLGTLPPASGLPEPSLPQANPDVTPGTGSPPPPSAPVSPDPSAPPLPSGSPPTASTIVRAYFYLDGDRMEGLVPVLREVPRTQAVARAAILQLIAGPSASERDSFPSISSAMPDGTELLGINIENGTATVDLSGEFASGSGSAGEMIRLAQVTYTLTQFPTVQRVLFWIDGRRVDLFGSHGIVLDGPVARDAYHDLLPPIWVDRPAYGAALGNPGRVSGLSNEFEATFMVSLLDARGSVLFDQHVMATCGTGCWGTFDVTIAYDVPDGQWGTLRVYAQSAEDGSDIDVRDYPVWLTPAG